MSGSLKRIGMAVVGLGRAGQIHFNNVVRNSRIELKWVIDHNQDAARTSLQKYGLESKANCCHADEFETVLRDDSVDAVVISTPTDTHADLSIQALRAGKHVMCEKPISEDTSSVLQCFDEADKHGKVLLATFNRKFDASYRDIYNRVRSGELGDIHFIRSTFRDAPLWIGADTLSQTFLCHDIDILCWMADNLPETVYCSTTAFTKELIAKNDVDTIVATLKFPNGAIGVLDFSRYSCYGYDIRNSPESSRSDDSDEYQQHMVWIRNKKVFGSQGMLSMDAATQTDVMTYKSQGILNPPFRISFPDRFEKAYVDELDHFIDVISGKAKLFVPREASERVAFVSDALRESYETGRIVDMRGNK